MEKLFGHFDKRLVIISLGLCVFLTLFAMIFTDAFGAFWSGLNSFLCTNFGWLYILAAAAAIGTCFFVALSKIGKLKFGKPDDKPEYSTVTWLAMMFSCGMGVALYFYCVSEPFTHYFNTPYLADPQSSDAVIQALTITTMHNGIPCWSIDTLAGVGIGYAAYRHGRPLLYSSAFYGLLGDRIHGVWGTVLNCLCCVVTIAGLTTSLGMAVLSISYMIGHITGIEVSLLMQVIVSLVIAAVFCLSVSGGLAKGMALISNWNVYIAIAVGVFVLAVGPTVFILNLLPQVLGNYANHFFEITLWTDAMNTTDGWLNSWSVFYWAWCIAWAPFVGGFFARISRGRSIRQFILCAILLPAGLCFVWLIAMGGYSFSLGTEMINELWATIQTQNEAGLAMMLETLPFAKVLIVIAIVNLILFIATSVDSGATYCSILFSHGNPTPKRALRLLSAFTMMVLPIAMIIGGGLKALQTMSIVMAFPLCICMLLMVVSIYKMVKTDPYADEEFAAMDAARAERIAAKKAAKAADAE